MVSDAARILDGLLEEHMKALKARKPPKPPKVISADYGDRHKIPPSPEEVAAYSAAIGYPLTGKAWCDAYGQKGWMVGKTRMKDWQCAVRNWKNNKWGQGGITTVPTAPARGGFMPKGSARPALLAERRSIETLATTNDPDALAARIARLREIDRRLAALTEDPY